VVAAADPDPACEYTHETTTYRNERTEVISDTYGPSMVPVDAGDVLTVFELTPPLGTAEIDYVGYLPTNSELPLNVLYTSIDLSDRTLIFTNFVQGNISISICGNDLPANNCVNCNVLMDDMEYPTVIITNPNGYSIQTGNQIADSYPNMIFEIRSVCGNFNNINTIVVNGTSYGVSGGMNVFVPASPTNYNNYNYIITDIPIPGLTGSPPTENNVNAAIDSFVNAITSFSVSGTMVTVCDSENPITIQMYSSLP
jgi:hypothetical protein